MKRRFTIFTLVLAIMCLPICHSSTAKTNNGAKSILAIENTYLSVAKAMLAHLIEDRVNLYQIDLRNCITTKNEDIDITINENSTATATEIPQTQTNEIYIGNINSKKFHTAECWTLPIEKNRVEFSSREDAINNNYSPCKNCNP